MDRRDIFFNLPLAGLACGLFPGQAIASPILTTPIESAAEIGHWLIAHGAVDPDAVAQMTDLKGKLSATQVRDMVRHDFARGQMVSADGWWISRTEAHVCVLAALCDSNGPRA